MGKVCKNHCPAAVWRNGELLPQGLNHPMSLININSNQIILSSHTWRYRSVYLLRRIRITESYSCCISQFRATPICMGQILSGQSRDLFSARRVSRCWGTGKRVLTQSLISSLSRILKIPTCRYFRNPGKGETSSSSFCSFFQFLILYIVNS